MLRRLRNLRPWIPPLPTGRNLNHHPVEFVAVRHANHATGRPAGLPEGPGVPVLAVLEVSLSARLKVLFRFLPVEDMGLVRVETFFPPVNNPLGHDPIGEPVG